MSTGIRDLSISGGDLTFSATKIIPINAKLTTKVSDVNWLRDSNITQISNNGTDIIWNINYPANTTGYAREAIISVMVGIEGDEETKSFVVRQDSISVIAPVADPGSITETLIAKLGTQVNLTCATEGATIRFTTDNHDPTANSTTYSSEAPITINSDTVIKARAFKNGLFDSDVVTYRYSIDKVEAPVANPDSGSVLSGTKVTLSCATPGATIYYTEDGTEPTTSCDQLYDLPIEISAATTIKAKAFKNDMYASDTTTFTYSLKPAIVVSDVQCRPGKEVLVPVSLENNTGITGMRFEVSFDDAVLRLVDFEDTTLLKGANHPNHAKTSPYTFSWQDMHAQDDNKLNGEILILKFKVLNNTHIGEYDIMLSYSTNNIIDKGLRPVGFGIINGSITVTPFAFGDVNGDETVDFIDAFILARYSAGWSFEDIPIKPSCFIEYAADVNEDSRIDFIDAFILARHTAGWPDYAKLPYKPPPSFQVFVTSLLSENDTPTINVGDATGKLGDIVEVPINLENNPGIIGIRFNISFDDTALRLVRFEDTQLLKGANHPPLTGKPPCTFAWQDMFAPNNRSNGEILVLFFEILEAQPGEYKIELSYSPNNIINTNLQPVSFNVKNGTIAEPVDPSVLRSIAVTPPEKTTYFVGDTLDLAGMVVTAYYGDGTSAQVTDYTTNPSVGEVLNIAGVQIVEVIYVEGDVSVTDSFYITVKPEQLPYMITIAPVENGMVTADKTVAFAGERITLTATPHHGYQLRDGSLTYNDVPIVGYSFIMPTEDAIVTAEFELKPDGGDGKLLLSVPFVTSYPGELVTIDIAIENNPGVKGFTLDLPFDSNKLKFVSLDAEILESLGGTHLSGDTTNRVYLTWLATGSNMITTDGKLFAVTFQVGPDTPGGEIPILLSAIIGDQMGNEISADYSNGAIRVIPYKLGDINDDGRIDILDAILLQRIWLGDLIPDARQRLAADVNKDGSIDGNDLVLLLMHIADPENVPLG